MQSPTTHSHVSSRTHHVGVRVALLAAGAILGAFTGAAVTDAVSAAPSAPAAARAGNEGAGYGGTASSLRLTVQGEQLLVTGMGFAAGASVEVRAGELTTVVQADEFGEVHAVLLGSVDTAAADITATGTGSDGTTLTLGEPAAAGTSGATGSVLGAIGGALAALLVGRRKATL